MTDYLALVKKLSRKIIAGPDEFPVRFNYGTEDIAKIIPHRHPFLLIDELTAFDPGTETICGQRFIDPSWDIFKGHFPGNPVYPGCLEIEMTGQLGLCLYYFLTNKTNEIKEGFSAPNIAASRVLGAAYASPIFPGKTATIIARKLESDDFLAKVAGQVIVEGKIACAAISEVCFI